MSDQQAIGPILAMPTGGGPLSYRDNCQSCGRPHSAETCSTCSGPLCDHCYGLLGFDCPRCRSVGQLRIGFGTLSQRQMDILASDQTLKAAAGANRSHWDEKALPVTVPTLRELVSRNLEDIQDQGLIYPDGGAIAYESIIAEKYPAIDVDLLTVLMGDHLMDWHGAIEEYMAAKFGEKRL